MKQRERGPVCWILGDHNVFFVKKEIKDLGESVLTSGRDAKVPVELLFARVFELRHPLELRHQLGEAFGKRVGSDCQRT